MMKLEFHNDETADTDLWDSSKAPRRYFVLYTFVGTHKCRVLLFIAVELNCRAVVTHVCEDISYLLLLTFSQYTFLSFNSIIGCAPKGVDEILSDIT